MRIASSSNSGLQATAVLTGSLLAGAMMGISLISIPVLVDINPDPAHLLRQWTSLYGYGIRMMPAGAISTMILYLCVIASRARASRPWLIYALAAGATMCIIPFTILVMMPTNDELFAFDSQMQVLGIQDLTRIHQLIEKWRLLHIGRSMFPLIGATFGLAGLMQEVRG